MMSQSVVLSFLCSPEAAEPQRHTNMRKRITIKHPAVTAWAQSGSALRISLRVTQRGVFSDAGTAPEVMAVAAMSGPFFDGTDGE